MDILFCDICNESVPQADVELGWAVRRKGGRLVCMRCDAAMTGTRSAGEGASALVSGMDTGIFDPPMPLPPDAGARRASPPPRPAAPAGGAKPSAASVLAPPHLDGKESTSDVPRRERAEAKGENWPGLVALVFTAAAGWLLLDRLDRLESRYDRELEQITAENARADRRVRNELGDLTVRLSDTETRLGEALEQKLTPLAAEIDELSNGLERQTARWEDVNQSLEWIRSDVEKSNSNAQLTFDRFAARIERVDEELRFLRGRSIDLDERMRALETAGLTGVVLPGATAEGDGAAAGAVARWSALLPDLEHASAAIRLEAVYALGDTGDPGVIPHLLLRLSDSDMFVRLATVRALESLGTPAGERKQPREAREAVPALIDTLEDAESAVREVAAVALRAITGQNFRFDANGSEGDREKRVRDWRNWWKSSGEDFLNAGA